MRVHVAVAAFFDKVPVPPDVEVTAADLASGRVTHSRSGGHLMKVTRKAFLEPKHEVTCTIAERDIIQKMIHISLPPPRGRNQKVSRKEAMASLLAEHVMPEVAAPKHMLSFTVEDDGPDEKLFRSEVEPLTKIEDEKTGGGTMIVPPEDFDELLGLYMGHAPPEHHVEHLHAKFGVKKGGA